MCGVYTLRRTHGCCYWRNAKLRFSNFCRKNEQDCIQTYQLTATMLNLSSTHAVSRCCSTMSSMLSYFTIVLTVCRLATRASEIFANFESMKTSSTMLGLVTSLKMMVVVLKPWTKLTAESSTHLQCHHQSNHEARCAPWSC